MFRLFKPVHFKAITCADNFRLNTINFHSRIEIIVIYGFEGHFENMKIKYDNKKNQILHQINPYGKTALKYYWNSRNAFAASYIRIARVHY